MNRAFHMLLLTGFLLVITGCKSKPKPKAEPTGQATLIGIIEMVNPEQNYVLIRCEPMPSISPGTELIALSSTGTKSKLVLTPEKKGYYVTADIKEGRPEVHHLVLLQRSQAPATDPLITPPKTTVTPSAAAQSSSSPSIPYQPMPSLPDFTPATSGSPAPPPQAPTPADPPKSQPQAPSGGGLDGLEPPVGGRP
ncbi:MAG: hypothetical protein V4662_03745 [Verrucomicrobiota bacterium]